MRVREMESLTLNIEHHSKYQPDELKMRIRNVKNAYSNFKEYKKKTIGYKEEKRCAAGEEFYDQINDVNYLIFEKRIIRPLLESERKLNFIRHAEKDPRGFLSSRIVQLHNEMKWIADEYLSEYAE